MSDPENRLHLVVQDPPVLRALLLAAGNDQELTSVITRAYHGHLEGAKGSPFVAVAVLLSAIGNAIMVRLDNVLARTGSSPNSNGSSPSQGMTPAQYYAISDSLKALPSKQDVQTSNAELIKAMAAAQQGRGMQKVLEELSDIRHYVTPVSHKDPAWKRWAKFIGIVAGILAVGFAVGAITCWFYVQHDANARVDRVVASQPASIHATAALVSHGGSVTVGQVNGADGKPVWCIIVSPGNLRVDNSTHGAWLLTEPHIWP